MAITQQLIVFTALTALTAPCLAQQPPDLPGGYPNRPVRVLLGSTPGGGSDLITRRVLQQLGTKWDRTFIAENRPGADGAIAYDIVVKAPPDGYTLLGAGSTIITGWPTKRLPSDPRKSIDPVVEAATIAYLLVVNAALPVKSLKDLVALGKSRPGGFSYASSGNGSAGHLGMEFFRSKVGLDMTHIPYKGNGQAMVDLISGQVQLLLSGPNGGGPHIRSGKIRPIAVTGESRMGPYPDVPTLSESGIPGLAGFEVSGFHGLFAPLGTPAPIANAINQEVFLAMNSPAMKDQLAADGSEPPLKLTPAQFKDKLSKKIDSWEKFLATSGIKL
jgi:tripartite-type tricarboxylate transporter receptor subunit TctC